MRPARDITGKNHFHIKIKMMGLSTKWGNKTRHVENNNQLSYLGLIWRRCPYPAGFCKVTKEKKRLERVFDIFIFGSNFAVCVETQSMTFSPEQKFSKVPRSHQSTWNRDEKKELCEMTQSGSITSSDFNRSSFHAWNTRSLGLFWPNRTIAQHWRTPVAPEDERSEN